MTSFRLSAHSMRDGDIVEILDQDGRLLAALYPAKDGVRLVSKYLTPEKVQHVGWDRTGVTPLPPSLEIKLP